MESTTQYLLLPTRFFYKIRFALTYLSVFLFIGLVGFISISINDYVSDTMSITLAEPEALTSQVGASVAEDNEEISRTTIIRKGDTLKTILTNEKLSSIDITEIIKLAEEQKISSSLQIGQQITFDYDLKIIDDEENDLTIETRTLTRLTINIDKINSLEIIREGNNFVAKNTSIPLNKFVAKSSTVINSSFMAALKSLGLSTNSIIELINSYSYQIDFQRQIQPGDTITVITEKFSTEDGRFSHFGKILFASLNLSGKDYNIYRYSPDNSLANLNFFAENGKSVKGSLLRTPVKLLRVSSHYGNRMHPTLGYTKMHKGVDFPAPSGTPIYAAGDGIITEFGWKGGYGKFIQIKHSPTLSTAYAHASNFAKNLKTGSRVKQGQVIAYVGKTGRATGPHLHYEVKVDGKNVNPMSIKTTPGVELTKSQLVKFQQFKQNISNLSKKLDNKVEIAENSVTLPALQ